MVNAFPAIVYAVTLLGFVLAFTRLWPFRAARDVGQTGQVWMAHSEDIALEQGPDPCVNDAPIEFRPLRARL